MDDNLLNFIKVVDIGNITKAAKILHITQPALSISLKKLENRYHTQFLIRTKKGITLTEAGKILYKHSKRIKFDLDNLQKELINYSDSQNNEIRMGMIDNVGLMSAANIKNILNELKNVNLHIEIDDSKTLVKRIEEGSLEFAIVTHQIKKLEPNLKVEHFADEKLVFVGRGDLIRKIKSKKDLLDINFLTYNKESTTYETINKNLIKNNIEFKNTIYSSSPDLIIKMIKLGIGIAILPRNFVLNRSNGLCIINFRWFRLKRSLDIVYRSNNYFTNLTKRFLDLVKESYKTAS